MDEECGIVVVLANGSGTSGETVDGGTNDDAANGSSWDDGG